MTLHLENFVAIRTLAPLRSRRYQLTLPASTDYQSLFEEANDCFFHREYQIALGLYLQLRNTIVVHSHPEVAPDSLLTALTTDLIEWPRIVELSRAFIEKTPVGGKVSLPLSGGHVVAPGKFTANPRLKPFGDLGLDVQRRLQLPHLAAADVTRQIGVQIGTITKQLSIDGGFATQLQAGIYETRKQATTLDALDFHLRSPLQFAIGIPHLFFFTLPIAIGDAHTKLGNHGAALAEYKSVLAYPYLNLALEAPFVWQHAADVYLQRGDDLFRQGKTVEAKTQYEAIIRTDKTINPVSPLYAPPQYQAIAAAVTAIANKLDAPDPAANPALVERVLRAYRALQLIAHKLNFIGLPSDYEPLLRFKYLQGVASYLADAAAQAERSFLQFRASAENARLENVNLKSSVDSAQASLAIENKRTEDATLEQTAAEQSEFYAVQVETNIDDAIHELETTGVELAGINQVLNYASNSLNTEPINWLFPIQYDGTSHDVDPEMETRNFVDLVGGWKADLEHRMEVARFERQRSEADIETQVAHTRSEQARVRVEIQKLNVALAETRLAGAQQALDYSTNRLLDDDMWFKLAANMEDLARDALDMATYAAFVMQRAYALEYDRDLKRIRLDYSVGQGSEAMLAADYLKRDINSFTIDLLQNAEKKDPVRQVISLRDEFPLAFEHFIETGVLSFSTDLELFDRRYPGTLRRKLKQIEVFVEGLVPVEGVTGRLIHQGISTEWAFLKNQWTKRKRAVAAQTMTLSSYQLRRDISVFAPPEETLGLFENLGVQGNWRIEIPRASNDIAYDAISDIKLAVYFTVDHSGELETFQKSFYATTGGRNIVLSSRFHFPDEYFGLDTNHRVTFTLAPARFPYNCVDLALTGFAVKLLASDGTGLAGQPIVVKRKSDGSTVAVTTDAKGSAIADPTTMAPFAAWKGQTPADAFTVELDAAIDPKLVADIQLQIAHSFEYRADGTP